MTERRRLANRGLEQDRCSSSAASTGRILVLLAAVGMIRPLPLTASEASAPVGGTRPALQVHETVPNTPQTFGTTAWTVSTMSAYAFVPNDSSTTYTFSSVNGGQYATGGHGYLNHSLQLPEGARVVRIELDGCDNDSSFITLRLSKCAVSGPPPVTASPCTDLEALRTGGLPGDTPGCGRYGADVDPPLTIDNRNNSYSVNVKTEGGPDTSFFAVRVYYQLQVSPAPVAATFADVPTDHPFFRHIEALAAAGITVGCGSGNFCPSRSITRAEMAAFLAKALGLHWPSYP